MDEVKPYMFEPAAGSVKSTRKIQLWSFFYDRITETYNGSARELHRIGIKMCLILITDAAAE